MNRPQKPRMYGIDAARNLSYFPDFRARPEPADGSFHHLEQMTVANGAIVTISTPEAARPAESTAWRLPHENALENRPS